MILSYGGSKVFSVAPSPLSQNDWILTDTARYKTFFLVGKDGGLSMKQISELEEKPITSSLNIYPEA
jgi:hypothetical protein